FKTLGYVIHLLQDMAVPAHTRNDFSKGHLQYVGISWNPTKLIGNPFEDYVKDNFQNEIFPAIISNISFPYKGELRLTNFWDTDTIKQTNYIPQSGFDIGLSEYSNTNFVSHNTIFKEESNQLHFFPYPNKDSITDPNIPDQIELNVYEILAKDGFTDLGIYVDKNKHGENIDKFLTPRYMFYDYKDETKNDLILKFEYFLDDQCYLEYAKKLIPRAIGYSASLIDYFFRGKIDIQHVIPHYGSDLSITSLNFSIKNTTPPIMESQTVEPMSSGYFELIISYKDTDGTIVRNLVPTNVYTVTDETDPVNSEFVSIQIPLVDYIPIDAEDLAFTVIFKGRLGYEEGAVAAQIYNFQNAGRIAYYNQPNGPQNTSNIFTISPDGSHPFQVTQMNEPNPWYFAPVWSKDGSKLAFEESGCLTDGYDPLGAEASCLAADAYRDIVIVDTGLDIHFPNNILYRLNFNGAAVANPTFSPDGTKIAGLLRNESGFYYYGNIVSFNLSDSTSQVITDYDANRTSLGNSRPAWSPTGESIAYYIHYMYDDISNSWEPVGDIFLVDPVDGTETRLTNDGFFNLQPAWSPDGNLIVFSSDRDSGGSMDIWLMYKDGTNLIQLYDSPADLYNPTFSPDGRKVAFSNGSSIYTIDIDGDLASVEEVASTGLLTGGLDWSSYLPPPSLEVQVNPSTVAPSQPSTITWQSEDATEVAINGITGIQPPDGSVTVFPKVTTTYTTTAFGVKGTQESTITITVE
ncbi:MAG: hypothetical protein ACN4GW_21895, partial [Desulforhopalus sp.]